MKERKEEKKTVASNLTKNIFCIIGRYVVVSYTSIRGAVVANWIRPQTLNHEVCGSNLVAAEVPLGKSLYPHCISLGKDYALVLWLHV